MHIRPAQPRPNARLSVAIVAVCLAAAASSCNEPTAPGAERELRDVIALASAADRLGSVGNTMMATGFVPPIQPDPICDYVVADQRFECPAIGALGFVILRRYQLRDAAGQPLARWSGAVASILNIHELAGSNSASVTSGADTATLTGVGEATHTLTGTRRITYTTSNSSGSTTRIVTRVTNLTIPKAGTVESYPTGTISFTGSGGFGPTSVEMTFDGTSKIKLVRTTTNTTFTTTVTCTYDLRPGIAPVCSST